MMPLLFELLEILKGFSLRSKMLIVYERWCSYWRLNTSMIWLLWFCKNCDILQKLWYFVKTVIFCKNCDILQSVLKKPKSCTSSLEKVGYEKLGARWTKVYTCQLHFYIVHRFKTGAQEKRQVVGVCQHTPLTSCKRYHIVFRRISISCTGSFSPKVDQGVCQLLLRLATVPTSIKTKIRPPICSTCQPKKLSWRKFKKDNFGRSLI